MKINILSIILFLIEVMFCSIFFTGIYVFVLIKDPVYLVISLLGIILAVFYAMILNHLDIIFPKFWQKIIK